MVKVQRWIFICFIWLKYETKNRFQSLVYNLPFGIMWYIQFLTINVAMLNDGWLAKAMNCLFKDQGSNFNTNNHIDYIYIATHYNSAT